MSDSSRRQFLSQATAGGAMLAMGLAFANVSADAEEKPAKKPATKMRFGLVTYMWGAEWDLPTLIANCEAAKVFGVELRTTHRHGVEPSLNKSQRKEVAKRFADTPVTLVGLGSNFHFDDPDKKELAKNIDGTKRFIELSHDVGGTGVKVKPNNLPKGVPVEKTIEQIGRSLNEVAKFGAGFGQQMRLEVHGQCAKLPTMKKIMDVADHPGAVVCWNCNQQDLQGKGLDHNFSLVCDRLGATLHCRRVNEKKYPFGKLIKLLTKIDYAGWIMLEEGRRPKNPAEELKRQSLLFDQAIS